MESQRHGYQCTANLNRLRNFPTGNCTFWPKEFLNLSTHRNDILVRMQTASKLGWLLALESGVLLILCFPVAGPLPHWRAALAWIAITPLLLALLASHNGFGWRRVGRNVLLGYAAGTLWYAGSCYWIDPTMRTYGNLPASAAFGILLLFSLYLGLYLALFALAVTLTRRALGTAARTLCVVPFLWVAVELACARITSFPWDQLGYSQIDNLLLTRLAPWTGNYGLSFVIASINCVIAAAFLLRGWRIRILAAAAGVAVALLLQLGMNSSVPTAPVSQTAVLLQPDISAGAGGEWTDAAFNSKLQRFTSLSESACAPVYTGLPPARGRVTPACRALRHGSTPLTDLIVWPESPAPFENSDPRLRHWLSALAEDAHAPMIVGDIAVVKAAGEPRNYVYNSAAFIAPDGTFVGRYSKMHLVPFGEYVPFASLFSFAGSLTAEVGQMSPGIHRVLFASGNHRLGVFICYESIFADEVRQFSRMGADVLVNISDDGWYGDTSAPWQHLNIARMRAIENNRWLLRDTNSGITAAIDPYGRVVASAPRHALTSLYVHYGLIETQTFYTRHGDLFAWLCAIIAVALAVDGAFTRTRQRA
jgi:apolipoprotein N-acyltransferase